MLVEVLRLRYSVLHCASGVLPRPEDATDVLMGTHSSRLSDLSFACFVFFIRPG